MPSSLRSSTKYVIFSHIAALLGRKNKTIVDTSSTKSPVCSITIQKMVIGYIELVFNRGKLIQHCRQWYYSTWGRVLVVIRTHNYCVRCMGERYTSSHKAQISMRKRKNLFFMSFFLFLAGILSLYIC